MITQLPPVYVLESSSVTTPRLDVLTSATASPRPLGWFRIGFSSVLIIQALSLIGHLNDLFGPYGVVAWWVTAEDMPAGVPHLAWIERAVRFLGGPAQIVAPVGYAMYVGGLIGLLLGYRTRISACVAWLAHAALLTSGDLSMYGVDRFAQIGLFYCLWFPVSHAISIDASTRRVSSEPSFDAWLGLRMLQLHVCVVYFASGLEKSMGEQWWTGEAVWRAVMTTHDPPFDCSFIATVPGLAISVCWLTLLLETGAILFVWHRHTRRLWLAGIVSMHLGIAVLMNLWTFSAVMVVFDIAAFGLSTAERPIEGGSCESQDQDALRRPRNSDRRHPPPRRRKDRPSFANHHYGPGPDVRVLFKQGEST